MKKALIFIVVLILGAVAFNYVDILKNSKQPLLSQLKSQPILNQLKKEILTPGPLRGNVNSANANLTRIGTIIQTNQERQNNGLKPLAENSKLDKAAKAKMKDMFEGQYFEHISPEGIGPADLAQSAGYEYIMVGENLALGNYKNDKELVTAWMNSPGHRANILNEKFTEIGVAVGRGMFEGKETWLAVQEFGRPASTCPKVDNLLKEQITSQKTDVENLESQITALKNDLDSMNPSTKEQYDAYNQKVAEYNALIKMYNNKIDVLKNLTNQYNDQVASYNACIQ